MTYYDTTPQLETCVMPGDLPSEQEMAEVLDEKWTNGTVEAGRDQTCAASLNRGGNLGPRGRSPRYAIP